MNLEEVVFIEAFVDHMVHADHHSPKGTDIAVNIYLDRALAGGMPDAPDRADLIMYMQPIFK